MKTVHVHALLGVRQHEWLRQEARRRRKSLSALLREIVEGHVNGAASAPRSLSDICGDVSDPGFSARDHDKILYGGPLSDKGRSPGSGGGRSVRRRR